MLFVTTGFFTTFSRSATLNHIQLMNKERWNPIPIQWDFGRIEVVFFLIDLQSNLSTHMFLDYSYCVCVVLLCTLNNVQ